MCRIETEDMVMLTPQEVMEAIVRALDSKKARDITVLKTEKIRPSLLS